MNCAGSANAVLSNQSVDRRVLELAGAEAVRTLAADAGVGAIARDRRRERPAAAPDVDALDLPAAQDAVDHGVRVGQEPPVAAEGQLVAGADRQVVRHVEAGERLLAAGVAADRRHVLRAQALRPRVRDEVEQAVVRALLDRGLQRVVGRLERVVEVDDVAVGRERPPRLDAAGGGLGDVDVGACR